MENGEWLSPCTKDEDPLLFQPLCSSTNEVVNKSAHVTIHFFLLRFRLFPCLPSAIIQHLYYYLEHSLESTIQQRKRSYVTQCRKECE